MYSGLKYFKGVLSLSFSVSVCLSILSEVQNMTIKSIEYTYFIYPLLLILASVRECLGFTFQFLRRGKMQIIEIFQKKVIVKIIIIIIFQQLHDTLHSSFHNSNTRQVFNRMNYLLLVQVLHTKNRYLPNLQFTLS